MLCVIEWASSGGSGGGRYRAYVSGAVMDEAPGPCAVHVITIHLQARECDAVDDCRTLHLVGIDYVCCQAVTVNVD